MSTSQLNRFTESLQAHRGEVTSIESGAFDGTLDDLIDPPAVGVPLDIPGVSLAETAVTTDPTIEQLAEARTGVTRVVWGVADYGSVLVRSTPAGTEPVSLFVDLHVAVLPESGIVPDMAALFESLGQTVREDRASHVIATGPSATADMGELVYGAHGPSDVHVICLTDR